MARSAPVAIATTAVSLATSGADASVLVHNSGASTVYLGGSDVSSTTGIPLAISEKLTVDLNENEKLYAVCASGTATLIVFQAGS